MKLYRARRTSERPVRHPVFLGNGPEFRVRGRWFTSDLEAAKAHGEMLGVGSDWEVIEVEIDPAMAETYCVANAPKTPCGLSPADYSQTPETDYVLPIWRTLDAVIVGVAGAHRQRDYLDMGRPGNVVAVDFTPGLGKTPIPAALAV